MPFSPPKEEIKAIIESLLFISEKPISIKMFATLLNITEEEIEKIIDELINDYQKRNSGILIVKFDDSYQMLTNPIYADWIKLFKNLNFNNKLSEQALETLAIIAYKQPITKAEVDSIRGVNSEYAIRTLLEKKLIKVVGKKEVPGRPFLYGTTKEFLKVFGITSLKELPNLNEFKINAA
ncbi:MAG: SMC-Scp complex subunit ScpB [Thermodesulfovibrio sp.]|nr:SMC-Scp complex subunit ScpB [Thermodesulfovibrio sp.]MDW7972937.1 SMC-Scp complex subunit ScpB [Thermodesulfovibrio sp.]